MSNTERVLAFIDAWNRMDWEAIGEAFITGMQPEGVDWEVIAIAENDEGQVLTERVDSFDMPGGKRISLPVMGTFELEDGKITSWRDYFDLATFTSQMA